MYRYLDANDPRFAADSDSATIQNAVDAAEAGGVSTVSIPRRCARTGKDEWIIDRTILLPSNITIILDDCRLTLAPGVYQNIFRNRNMYTDISLKKEGRQYGIRIIGHGRATLDGGEGNDLRESTSEKDGRPHVRFNNFVLLHNVQDFVLEGFRCVNMRWWALNHICCSHGRLSNLDFFNGRHVPNQDGINFRIGCSHMIVENITGRTGDDTVALTALPLCGDSKLVLEDGDVDIHDITIRNVRADTRCSVVALRNNDGAKLYRVDIENISDAGGGEYIPWDVVHLGENNYYRRRTAEPGETYDINVRGVYSAARGAVILGGTLKNARISDVYAGGGAMHAISSYLPTQIFEENGCEITGGVTLENVLFDNIHYDGKAAYKNQGWLIDTTEEYNGCALYFRSMRESDFFKRVTFRDIYAREGAALFMPPKNVENFDLSGMTLQNAE